MEKITRMLNLLSAAIMLMAGLYIHSVFGLLLTPATVVLLWMGIVLYAILQVEFGYGVIRKHIAEMMR
ncbi:MAG: hypothetical protein JSU74_11225 [Candidatus Zixiibacteriota bacterium]|nr:MAG: hypothetical protein JSU74_11225 [candidate division Zixibacteria bacterium]